MRTSLLIVSIVLLPITAAYGAETGELEKNWAPTLQNAVVSTVEKVAFLSDSEVEIYSALMSEPTLRETPTGDQVFRLKGMIASLEGESSYGAFVESVIEAEGLEDWLREIGAFLLVTCNCNSNWDCTGGYTCAQIACESAEGSNSTGVCTKRSANQFSFGLIESE